MLFKLQNILHQIIRDSLIVVILVGSGVFFYKANKVSNAAAELNVKLNTAVVEFTQVSSEAKKLIGNVAGTPAEQQALKEKVSGMVDTLGKTAKTTQEVAEKINNVLGNTPKEQKELQDKFSGIVDALGKTAKAAQETAEKANSMLGDTPEKQKELQDKFSGTVIQLPDILEALKKAILEVHQAAQYVNRRSEYGWIKSSIFGLPQPPASAPGVPAPDVPVPAPAPGVPAPDVPVPDVPVPAPAPGVPAPEPVEKPSWFSKCMNYLPSFPGEHA